MPDTALKPSRILLPLAPLYGTGVTVRNSLYDAGIFRSQKIGIPVISVGNLTAGGAGKTPFIEFLLRMLLQRGKKVAVVSRGYGRTNRNPAAVGAGERARGAFEMLGDELRQIAEKIPDATVIADANRVRGAKLAREKYGAEIILLDDGFQHRAIARDLDILLIDTTQHLAEEALLPAGLRREPLSSLNRAGLIAYTRADMARLPESEKFIPDHPGILVRFTPVGFHRVDGGDDISLSDMKGKPVVAFCGIGNPAAFSMTLERLNLDVREHMMYSDHHRFTAADLARIDEAARRHQAVAVTTEKDAARLAGVKTEAPIFALEIRAEIMDGDELLRKKIEELF